MRSTYVVALFAVILPGIALTQEKKQDPPIKRLVHADLAKLNGTWEMTVDLKSGWKGTINLVLRVNGPGGELDGVVAMVYWATLAKEDERLNVINARPPGQISTAGIKQGNTPALASLGREKKGDRWVP